MSSGDTLERGEIGWPWNELHRLEAELNTLRAELERAEAAGRKVLQERDAAYNYIATLEDELERGEDE